MEEKDYTKERDEEVYFCSRLRILSWLNSKGFEPFGTMPDRGNPSRTVWVFEKTPALYDALEAFYAERRAVAQNT